MGSDFPKPNRRPPGSFGDTDGDAHQRRTLLDLALWNSSSRFQPVWTIQQYLNYFTLHAADRATENSAIFSCSGKLVFFRQSCVFRVFVEKSAKNSGSGER